MKTSLIIADYKTMKETIAYLERCSKAISDWQDVSVVVVDNDPEIKDGSDFLGACQKVERIKNVKNGGMWKGTIFGRPVVYAMSLTNLGYGNGNNMGAAVAKMYFEPDFYLFSNNDLYFKEPFSLKTLQEPFAAHKETGAVGPEILHENGQLQNPGRYPRSSRALFADYWSLLLPRGLQSKKYGEWIRQEKDGFCDYLSGSFILVDCEKFVEVQGFDNVNFLYMDTPILSKRMERKGYRMYFTDQVKLEHKQRMSSTPAGGPVKNIRFDFQAKYRFYVAYERIPLVIPTASAVSFEFFFSLFWIKKMVLRFWGK